MARQELTAGGVDYPAGAPAASLSQDGRGDHGKMVVSTTEWHATRRIWVFRARYCRFASMAASG
jgi:hypothetical protein